MNLSRTLTVPSTTAVTPTVWVRARQGPNLADLVSAPGAARALGDADPIDVLGSAYAAADGDPGTAWTAPQSVVQHKTPPTLTLKLPARSEVAGLRITPSSSVLPAHPTLVAIDLGDGPEVRRLSSDGGTQTVSLRPRVTDTVKVSLLSWDRRHRPHRAGLRSAQAARAGRGLGAGRPGCADRGRRRRPQPCAGHRSAVRARPDHRRGGTVRPDLRGHHRRRAARRRARHRQAVPVRADHAARRSAGIASQPRRGVRGRRRPAGRSADEPITHGGNGSRRHGRLERRPPRVGRPAVGVITGAGGAREHQSRAGRLARRMVLHSPRSPSTGGSRAGCFRRAPRAPSR